MGRPPVLVMVAGYSRVITAVMLPSRQSEDLLAGHWRLIAGWGRVPRALVWDNERIKVVQCRPGDPEAKGLVERANGYLETSFLPGRSFTSPIDFNTQLTDWLARANQRHHRTLRCRPVDRWAADRAGMLQLPPVAPVTGWRLTTRLARDHYIRLDSTDYSAHPSVVGRRVHIVADLTDVVVTCDGTEVARHSRCWADHQTITDPTHKAAAVELRQTQAGWRAGLIALPSVDTTVEHRDLGDYDRLFGLTGEEIA